MLQVKVFRGQDLLLTDELRSFLKYSDKREVEREEEAKYTAQGEKPARFLEILFTRVGIDLGEKMINMLKENSADLTGDRKASPGKGVLSISANVPNAEVTIDGGLIGTAPLTDIPLTAGTHVIEVNKKGHKTWRREVMVLEGAASALVAELSEIESSGQ